MPGKLALALAAVGVFVPLHGAGQSINYVDSSSADKLEGRWNLRLGAPGLALDADMRLIGQQGETRALPRITSSWSAAEHLDVKTVLDYGNLNAARARPKIDTTIVVESALAFVDKIEASIQRAESATRRSLGLRFSSLDTGIDVLGGDPLAFRAAMTVDHGERSAASSSLTSSWGLGSALTMQSVLKLDADRFSGVERSALDTKLVYRSPFAFIDRFEGEIHEGPDRRRQSLAVLLPELSGGDQHGTSFSVTGKALIREILDAAGAETRSLGFETKFKGFLPPLLGGQNAVSLRLERGLGADALYRSSLAYDHAWSPGDASIGLNVKMRREANEIEPSMDLSWSASF